MVWCVSRVLIGGCSFPLCLHSSTYFRTFKLEASYSHAVVAHLQLESWPDGLLDETMSLLPEQFAHHSGWLPHLRGVLWVLTSLRLNVSDDRTPDCPEYSLDVLLGIVIGLLRGVITDVARLVYLRRELGRGNRYAPLLLIFLIVSAQLVHKASLEIPSVPRGRLLLVLSGLLAVLCGSLGSHEGVVRPEWKWSGSWSCARG